MDSQGESLCSPESVDIRAMIDPIDIDSEVTFVDPIDDSVLADPGAVATGQLSS